MQKIKIYPVNFHRNIGKTVVLGALMLAVLGCVADPSPHGAYGTSYYTPAYAAPATSSTTVVTQPGTSTTTTTVVHNAPVYVEQESVPDYDNKWDYGRIGNGNYHGEGDDDVHNY
jgi:hypothetical protein